MENLKSPYRRIVALLCIEQIQSKAIPRLDDLVGMGALKQSLEAERNRMLTELTDGVKDGTISLEVLLADYRSILFQADHGGYSSCSSSS